jgi:hypothetical protein
MHNRAGEQVTPFEIAPRDGLVLVPLVLVIVAFAFYPQLALDRGERSARASVVPAATALEQRDSGTATAVTP